MIAKPKPTKADRPKKPKPPKVKKLDPDYYFSLCVRERADWICESCGKKYEPWIGLNGLPANPGLQCSHYVGRGNYAVRFEPLNVDAHCASCHFSFEGNPHVFREWKLERLGKARYEIVIEKSNNLMLGKQARREKQEIAEHYKQQFEIMQTYRSKGMVGRINFEGYL